MFKNIMAVFGGISAIAFAWLLGRLDGMEDQARNPKLYDSVVKKSEMITNRKIKE